jgi:hypothetical protein
VSVEMSEQGEVADVMDIAETEEVTVEEAFGGQGVLDNADQLGWCLAGCMGNCRMRKRYSIEDENFML